MKKGFLVFFLGVILAGTLRAEEKALVTKNTEKKDEPVYRYVKEVGLSRRFDVPEDYRIEVKGGGRIEMESTEQYCFRKIREQNEKIEELEKRLKKLEEPPKP